MGWHEVDCDCGECEYRRKKQVEVVEINDYKSEAAAWKAIAGKLAGAIGKWQRASEKDDGKSEIYLSKQVKANEALCKALAAYKEME